jgi:hexosaminidase
MRKIFACLFFLAECLFAAGQNDQPISLVPWPVSLTQKPGSFLLNEKSMIEVSSPGEEANRIGNFLSRAISIPAGYKIPVTNKMFAGTSIRLSLLDKEDKILGSEGYKLSVTPHGINLLANKPAGLFYGVQTILQLLPKEIGSKTVQKNIAWTIPAVEITDYPRFGWRGLLFDVVRHFYTKQQVKDFIDEMVKYKFNLLHLHLTDDQGWRIEIKSLPGLTKIGAWRAERVGDWGKFSTPTPDEPTTYGGFYTQDDMKEMIRYAKERFVDILPEIDVPGHSMAAIASYPELSCTPGEYHVNAGEKFMNWFTGGFSAMIDNTLCPANEKVYPFLDKVFTEVAEIFPFPYIHMGGDECAKNFWEKDDQVKALMKKEGLKNMDEVQSYFVKRVEKIIVSKGKKMLGWDEILEGGLPPEASVMSWRGMKGGIEAAKQGHHVVMSPQDYAYLDLYQGDPVAEPALSYAGLRLNQVYRFDPVPPGIDPSFILGGQGNLWSERLTTMRHLEYMLWPRGFALSESVWSPPAQKNWNQFITRVEKQMERLDVSETKYSRSMYDPIFTAKKDAKGELQIILSTEVEGLDIYYSFDETPPDKFYPEYTTPLSVPKDAINLKVITYRNGKQAGKPITMPIAELKKRAGIK